MLVSWCWKVPSPVRKWHPDRNGSLHVMSHADESKCFQRNRMMLDLADEAVIGHASPGGKLERLCGEQLLKKITWL